MRNIRRDLLEELRQESTDECSSMPGDTDKRTQSDHPALNDLVDYVEGATIGDMLDFLSKELIRLQSEQTIHLFACLADRQRCQREATETGNRTKILERQKIIDRAFQQVKLIHWSNHDLISRLDVFARVSH